jgi:AraC-like DNA-binding protein
LYVLRVDDFPGLPRRCRVDAWDPGVPGVAEVFHARIVDYAYPPHAHDTWTVLIVDDGAIRYHLDTRDCGAARPTVTILPPGVVHDGRPAAATGAFRKRNLYLDGDFLPASLVGAAVDRTTIADPPLRDAIAALHDALVARDDPLDAEGRLALVGARIARHLAAGGNRGRPAEPGVAVRLRLLLDEHTVEPITLREAGALLGRSPSHLVRSFTRAYGVSPHAYVIGRRIDAARRQLLAGAPPAQVAAAVGFYDQAHLTRHFRRHTSVTPARFAATHAAHPTAAHPTAAAQAADATTHAAHATAAHPTAAAQAADATAHAAHATGAGTHAAGAAAAHASRVRPTVRPAPPAAAPG